MQSETESSRDGILRQALALDPADRAYIVDELKRSLTRSMIGVGEIISAWSEEIDRRIGEYDRGASKAICCDETLVRARQALVELRSQRAKE